MSDDIDDATVVEAKQLELSPLVRVVLARNPGLESARQAWRGALAGYAEATSYEDTQLAYTVAPLSIVSADARFGHTIQVSQALPYPGKRKLRGEVVLAEAESKREGYRAVRRNLASMTGRLYYDYVLVGRALAINEAHRQLVAKYRDTVNIYMATAKAWLEDAATVRVAEAQLAQQRLDLEAARDVLVAQLNALMHRDPGKPLPPPPVELIPPREPVASIAALRDEAIAARPELRALRHRMRGASTSVALAHKERRPNFRLLGTYNTMFASIEHQIMVGVSMNLPVQGGRRRGYIDRSRASLRMTQAEERQLIDQIALEVTTAHRRVVAADRIVTTYRDSILPAATARVAANRAGLPTARTSFVDVIREERSLKALELEYARAIASAYRYRVDLDAAVGRVAGLPAEEGQP